MIQSLTLWQIMGLNGDVLRIIHSLEMKALFILVSHTSKSKINIKRAHLKCKSIALCVRCLPCLYICVLCACSVAEARRRRRSDPLGLESQAGVSYHANLRPLEKQLGYLAAEPLFQLQTYFLK